MKTIKIKKLPTTSQGRRPLKTGTQLRDYSLYAGDYPPYTYPQYDDQPASNNITDLAIRDSEPEVAKKDATIEAEKGEVIIGGDLGTLRKINGKKHSQGGTPLAPNPGDYIVSNTVEYTAPIAEALGLASSKKIADGTTWAKFLKNKVDPKTFNTYAALLDNKAKGRYNDPFFEKDAEIQLPDFQSIASKVALANELTKAINGQEFDIPQVAKLGMVQVAQNPPKKNINPTLETQAQSLPGFSKRAGLKKAAYGSEVNPSLNNYARLKRAITKGPEYEAENVPDFVPPPATPADPRYNNTVAPGGFSIFDQLNILEALGNKSNDYYPWAKKVAPKYVTANTQDANYNPLLAVEKTRGELLNQVSDPTTARYNMTYQPQLINGFLQETQRNDSMNRQEQDRTNMVNNQIYNQNEAQNAQIDTDLFNKNTMVKVNRDAERKLRRNDIMTVMNNAVNNRDKANMLKIMYPQFSYDDILGTPIFTGGLPNGAASPTQGQVPQNADIQKFLYYMNLSPEQQAMWDRVISRTDTTRRTVRTSEP